MYSDMPPFERLRELKPRRGDAEGGTAEMVRRPKMEGERIRDLRPIVPTPKGE